MYSPNSLSSFAPRNFKNVIGKYGPSFSGWQQQDSQEFLLFLLDGLQEDLNRVKKKPYIEKPDSTDEMVNDSKALMEMASKCWDIYKARNDSVITDLFAGMYKSTVVCPECEKVSIIFDPFNNLTLQLPIESLWSKKICFYPVLAKPILVSIDVDKHASFMAVKENIAAKVGTDPKRTVLAEVYKHKFYKFFDDKGSISDEHITESDEICLFELEDQPTNFPLQKKVTKAKAFLHSSTEEDQISNEDTSLLDKKMLVPVFNRRPKAGSSRHQQKELFAVPTFIIVNREEAKDYDTILRKVLRQVATLTTRDFLREGDGSEGEDSEEVLMNIDEADSSTDSRVQAKSLESEDGMVDVSMHNGEDTAQQPKITLDSKPIAPILRPGSFLTPGVRHLFDIKFVPSNGSDIIPAGLSTFTDESKNYPTLASRQTESTIKPKLSVQEEIRRRQEDSSPQTSDEDADNILPSAQDQAQAQDSGDESDGFPPITQLVRPPATGFGMSTKSTHRNNQGLITYSRKGKQAISRPRREMNSPPMEDATLLRLGESIMLDWTCEGYNSLFSGAGHDDDEMRGAPTFDNTPTLPDPELEEKRKLRNSRKRNGVTLGDCLDEFGKAEILSENDAWYCPRCTEHRRASKQFQLWKAPDILVIHLKRFSAQGRFRDKLEVHVDFPIQGLDLSTRLAVEDSEGKSPIYDLFAVDNHYGGLGGGHYTAYTQNFIDQSWYEYNGKHPGVNKLCGDLLMIIDSSALRRADPKAVVTPAAYLLFYRRRSPPILGGPFFEKLFHEHSESQSNSRGPSPAGEGKRLDDSSRTGSSSALRGVGAAHQAGGGGLMDGTVSMRTGVDDDLPAYSENDPRATTIDPKDLDDKALEGMELNDEEDEGIGGMGGGPFMGPLTRSYYNQQEPNWSFGELNQTHAPPVSEGEGEDEDLFEQSSIKAVGSSMSDDEDRNRMADFQDDEGTTADFLGTPPRGSTPMLDVSAQHIEDVDDEPVAEVFLQDNEAPYSTRMD